MVDTAIGCTDLHVFAVPGVLREEGVWVLVQADDDELPQVLLAPDSVLIHLGRAQGQLSMQASTLASQVSYWASSSPCSPSWTEMT